MQSPDHQQRLAALRETIADIERKPALAEAANKPRFENGMFPVLPAGLVQEVYADGGRDTGASLAFALTQAKNLLGGRRSAIFYVQLADEAQVFGLPYGPGLNWFGLDPSRLVIVRAANMSEFLWATEEAIACRAVAAIIAEVKGSSKLLNFTASRRLSMRASASRVSLFMLRYGVRRESSAGHLRWRILPQRSARHVFDDRAPGNARWHLKLERGRVAGNQVDWMLEARKNGFAIFSSQPAASDRYQAEPAILGAPPAVLAHRLSQAS
jgi:protein ImuA